MRFTWMGSAAAMVLFMGQAAWSGTISWSGPITDVDGRVGPQYTGSGSTDVQVRRRPWTATDKYLTLENYRIHDVSNQKGIHVSASLLPDGTYNAYKSIIIRHYEGARIERDETRFSGLHMDFLKIDGGRVQDNPTDVLLEDIWVHDGDALPLLLGDGVFGTVTIRDYQVENTTRGVQFGLIGTGSIAKLIIEDSPGLGVALMGSPGSIGQVIIRNSPGLSIADTQTTMGRSGAPITWESTPVPEPAMLGLLPMLGLLAARRRKA